MKNKLICYIRHTLRAMLFIATCVTYIISFVYKKSVRPILMNMREKLHQLAHFLAKFDKGFAAEIDEDGADILWQSVLCLSVLIFLTMILWVM